MFLKRQRGELSLLWVAVFMGALGLVAMAGLFWMRYERNLFAEIWNGAMRTPTGQTVKKTQAAVENSIKPESASGAIRKCTIDGKVVYSNVECNAKDPTSRSVKLHDSSGFDAPKAPPPAESAGDASMSVKDKMMEKAISR